jgi:hypothetical protein
MDSPLFYLDLKEWAPPSFSLLSPLVFFWQFTQPSFLQETKRSLIIMCFPPPHEVAKRGTNFIPSRNKTFPHHNVFFPHEVAQRGTKFHYAKTWQIDYTHDWVCSRKCHSWLHYYIVHMDTSLIHLVIYAIKK